MLLLIEGCQTDSYSYNSNNQQYFKQHNNIKTISRFTKQTYFEDEEFSSDNDYISFTPVVGVYKKPSNKYTNNAKEQSVFGDFETSKKSMQEKSKENTEHLDLLEDEIIDSPAMYKATMREYEVDGTTYQPAIKEIGYKNIGIASWYGPSFNGKKTSNGEIYNMNSFTGAHKTLPMNTVIKVTNIQNKKQAQIRINDRGPFVDNRILDLSFAASKALGIYNSGTAEVEIEVLGFNAKVGINSKTSSQFKEEYLGNIMLQIGVFSKMKTAKSVAKNNETQKYKSKINEYIKDGKTLFRVVLHNFKTEDEARDFKEEMHLQNAFITGE